MEALKLVSSVATVVKIVQEITKAVKTVSRNRKSCQELAERVNDIGELLKELDTDGSSPSTASAMRRMVRRLEGALRRALKLVRSCQGSVIRPYSLLVGGRMKDVNAEIDRCLLDLAVPNLALVSRLDHKLNAAAGGDPTTSTDHVTEDDYEDDKDHRVRGEQGEEMVFWDGLGQAATIAQLAGVDAFGLIKMIVEAAHTAKTNRETCQKLARILKMIGDLLQPLQNTQLMQHPETRNPVEGLEETLRRTYTVIASCQESSYLHRFFMGDKQANQLCELQTEIHLYLRLFPLVGFVDITRSGERLQSRAHPFCTEDITDELHTVHHSEHEIR